MTVLFVNIIGPDGTLVEAGQPVPKGWDADYVKSLTASGGAGTQKQWDAAVERNRIEAEARADEPPLPTWGQAEQREWSEYQALKAQLAGVAALGVDTSGLELPPEPPPPPQVPAAVKEAARSLLDADDKAVETAAESLRSVVAKTAKPSPRMAALVKTRHDLAGRIEGEAK